MKHFYSFLILCFLLSLAAPSIKAQINKTADVLFQEVRAYSEILANPNLTSIERQKTEALYFAAKQNLQTTGHNVALSWHIEHERQAYVQLLRILMNANLDVNSFDFEQRMKEIQALRPRMTLQEEQHWARRYLTDRDYTEWKNFYAQYGNLF